MNILTRGVAALFVVGCAVMASADSWESPRPQVFASTTGTFGFKVLPPQPPSFLGQGQGILFTLAQDGAETVVWKRELVNIPLRAIVTDDGKYVVTIDTWARVGYEHCLVIYGGQGRVVADFNLEALVSKDEIATSVLQTTSSRSWVGRMELNDRGDQVVVTLRWGRVIRVALSTGKIEAA